MAALTSLTNYMATATNIAGSSVQAGWPTSNMKYPQQPGTPTKSTNLTLPHDQDWDLGSAKAMDILVAVRINYDRVQIFLDSDTGFSPNEFDSGSLTVVRNPWNTHYTLVYRFATTQTKRYVRFRIPSGASVTDGTSSFSTGGIWVGSLTSIPRDIKWEERPQRVEPHIDIPLIGGGTHRVLTGKPYVEMRAERLAKVTLATPATGDQLGAWLEWDRLTGGGIPFAWYFNRGNTSEGFIFRRMNEADWPVHPVVAEAELVLHELVGP